MRKIALVAAISAAALSLAACSESTEQNAEDAVDGAAADTDEPGQGLQAVADGQQDEQRAQDEQSDTERPSDLNHRGSPPL